MNSVSVLNWDRIYFLNQTGTDSLPKPVFGSSHPMRSELSSFLSGPVIRSSRLSGEKSSFFQTFSLSSCYRGPKTTSHSVSETKENTRDQASLTEYTIKLQRVSTTSFLVTDLFSISKAGHLGLFYGAGVVARLVSPAGSWDDTYFPKDDASVVDRVIQGMYYASSVITTIYFGDMRPKSGNLEVFEFFYAMWGLVLGQTVLVAIIDSVREAGQEMYKRRQDRNLAKIKEEATGKKSITNESSGGDQHYNELLQKLAKNLGICFGPIILVGLVYKGIKPDWAWNVAMREAWSQGSTLGYL